MITEGTHRGKLRSLVDGLPDRFVDYAIDLLARCPMCDGKTVDGDMCPDCKTLDGQVEPQHSCLSCSYPISAAYFCSDLCRDWYFRGEEMYEDE